MRAITVWNKITPQKLKVLCRFYDSVHSGPVLSVDLNFREARALCFTITSLLNVIFLMSRKFHRLCV